METCVSVVYLVRGGTGFFGPRGVRLNEVSRTLAEYAKTLRAISLGGMS